MGNRAAVTPAALLTDREIGMPATLSLAQESFDLSRQLRFLPGRRVVLLGAWRGNTVIIKLFSGDRKARREGAREAATLKALARKGVPVPGVVGEFVEGGVYALVIRYIDGASAREKIDDPESGQAADVARELTRLTAAMHRAGVVQKDIHLGNFLCDGNDWHVIDAGDIGIRSRPVRGMQSLDNLAWLLAQFPPLSLPPADDLAACYGGVVTGPALASRVRRVRTRRLRKLVRKTMRDCTEFTVLKSGGYQGMARRDGRSLVDRLASGDMDRWVDQGRILKQGNSTTVAATSLSGENLVLKRYNITSLWRRITRQVRSRARNSWKNAAFLRYLYIGTPDAYAFLSRKKFGIIGKEYLVCREVQGRMLPDICENDPGQATSALEQLADLFFVMRLTGFSHGDSKYTNFIFENGRLMVIDLDGMKRPPVSRLEERLSLQHDRLFESWWGKEALAEKAREEFRTLYRARLESMRSWL